MAETPTPSAPTEANRPLRREPSALQQVLQAFDQLVADGKPEEAREFLVKALEAVLRKADQLELLVLKLQRERVGKRSEKVDSRQLLLMLEALDESEELPVDLETESKTDAEMNKEIEDLRKAAARNTKRKDRVSTRGVDHEVHEHLVSPEERLCPICGKEMAKIGEDGRRVLEYQPGRFVEHENRLEKCACTTCKEGVTTAPGPKAIIERSPAGASLLAHVVVSKFVDHCPFHRLRRSYLRNGTEVSVSTLSEWTAGVADLVRPLVDVLEARLLGAYVVATDATGIKVLDHSSPENIEKGTMWCYVGDDLDVVFRYTETGEGATGPWQVLEGRQGYIRADGANIFDRLFNGMVASAVELGCWAHGRRRLVAMKDTDFRVAYPLTLISRLYRLETLADERKLSTTERAKLRQERSSVELDKLKRWLLITHANEPPSTDMAKATGYILNQWDPLVRFVDDGRLRLDNNICEGQIRDLALGRRNYLFAGSHDAARRIATLYSLTRTCAQHGVAPLPYLTDVLRKLADGWEADRLEELLPDRWQAMYAPATQAPAVLATG